MHLTSKPRFWRRDVYSQPTLLSRTSQACVVSANDEPSARLVRRIRLPVTSRNSVGGSMCSLMKEHVLWVRTCLDPTPSLGAATYFSLLYNHIQTSTNLVSSNHSRKNWSSCTLSSSTVAPGSIIKFSVMFILCFSANPKSANSLSFARKKRVLL